MTSMRLPSAVRCSSVGHHDDCHGDHLVIHSVDDAVLPATSAVETGQLADKWLSDAVGVLGECPEHELEDGGGDGFGQSVQVASR